MKKTLLTVLLSSLLTLPVAAKTSAALPLDEIRNFVDVYNTIKNEYVEEKDGKTLIDFAIEGMLNGLDPHSIYLKKSLLEDFTENTSGSYVGFGFSIEMNKGRLIVISPIADSPAEKAGILPGDHIVKIDDTLINNMSMPEVDELLKAKESVTLTIDRKNSKTQVVDLTRTTINLPSVGGRLLDDDYGYIRVTQFQDNTAEQFSKQLQEQLGQDIKGLVLDLRNNPGGLVKEATDIADNFLDAGLIVSTKNQNNGSEEKVHANKQTAAKELPLVILINEGSASASELLAGALQSHRRAIVVGQPSFGKGSVQNIIPLSNGDAIKLTTARYYTPDGKSIQAKGITPDIVLSRLTVSDKDKDLLSYGEANFADHLNPPESSAKEQETPPTTDEPDSNQSDSNQADGDANALAKSDLQLFEALNVLKVLNLQQR